MLSDNVERTMEHAIVNEEKIPLELVTNLQEVCQGTDGYGWLRSKSNQCFIQNSGFYDSYTCV